MPTSSSLSSSSSNNRGRRRRGRNQNYTSLATNNQDDDDDDIDEEDNNSIIEEFQDEPSTTTNATVTTTTTTTTTTAMIPATMKSLVDDDESENEEEDDTKDNKKDEKAMITIIILDSAQKKFPIKCHPSWTVGKFKYQSSLVHQVHPKQQRLIFRGKMLTNDTQTLLQNHINASDITVHLFPKPIIKITTTTTNNSGSGDGNNNESNDNGDADDGNGNGGGTGTGGGGGGAHIPSIVIDQDEQDRRGQILVLGSVEIAESQNNVKMLSLLLVMICAMRLLALLSIAMGGGEPIYLGDEDGDQVHNHTADHPHSGIYDTDFLDDTVDLLESSSDNYAPRAWALSDYYDLLVSSIGFYVGTLGMKATQENTLHLATLYAIGTIIAGILWNVWNVYEYIDFFHQQQTLYEDNEYDSYEDTQHHATHHATTGSSSSSSSSSYNTHDPNHPLNNNNHKEYGAEDEDLPPLTRDDYVTVAFFTIVMPLGVWFLCCIRAFEFRRLIQEAEEEASERIRNEYVVDEETDPENNTTDTAGNGNSSSSSNNNNNNDGESEGTNSITEIV